MNIESNENTVPVGSVEQQSADSLRMLALTLYECFPGGPVVRDPAECRSYDSSVLPDIELFDSASSERG